MKLYVPPLWATVKDGQGIDRKTLRFNSTSCLICYFWVDFAAVAAIPAVASDDNGGGHDSVIATAAACNDYYNFDIDVAFSEGNDDFDIDVPAAIDNDYHDTGTVVVDAEAVQLFMMFGWTATADDDDNYDDIVAATDAAAADNDDNDIAIWATAANDDTDIIIGMVAAVAHTDDNDSVSASATAADYNAPAMAGLSF